MPRISIEVMADDQSDGELVSRLITANLNAHGFDDVTNVACPTHNDQEEEVVEAMHNLNPSLFQYEVSIDVSLFDNEPALAGADQPGEDEFPDDETDENEDRDPLED